MKIRKKVEKINRITNKAVVIKTVVVMILKTIGIKQTLGVVGVIGWLVTLRSIYIAVKKART